MMLFDFLAWASVIILLIILILITIKIGIEIFKL